jgi:hypothetical protein
VASPGPPLLLLLSPREIADATACDPSCCNRDDRVGGLHPSAGTARSSRPCWRSWSYRPGRSGWSPGGTRPARTRRWPSRGRQDQSDRRVRRARLADKAPLDPAANAARPERRAPPVQQGRRARQVRRVIPARRRQFALSPARTLFAVRTTRYWPVWFVRAARPTERNARRLARRQPDCVYVGDLKSNLKANQCGAFSEEPFVQRERFAQRLN